MMDIDINIRNAIELLTEFMAGDGAIIKYAKSGCPPKVCMMKTASNIYGDLGSI